MALGLHAKQRARKRRALSGGWNGPEEDPLPDRPAADPVRLMASDQAATLRRVVFLTGAGAFLRLWPRPMFLASSERAAA